MTESPGLLSWNRLTKGFVLSWRHVGWSWCIVDQCNHVQYVPVWLSGEYIPQHGVYTLHPIHIHMICCALLCFALVELSFPRFSSRLQYFRCVSNLIRRFHDVFAWSSGRLSSVCRFCFTGTMQTVSVSSWYQGSNPEGLGWNRLIQNAQKVTVLFLHYWTCVLRIQQSVDSPHKGQYRRTLILECIVCFSIWCILMANITSNMYEDMPCHCGTVHHRDDTLLNCPEVSCLLSQSLASPGYMRVIFSR